MAELKLSQAAYDRLKAEHEHLTTTAWPEVVEKIRVAREEGDLRENAGYHAAKEEQGVMKARIDELEHLLEHAEIVEDQAVYTIVFDGDSDDDAERYLVGHAAEAADGIDVISPSSALGQALVGAQPGETVSYEGPTGAQLTVRVLAVEAV